MTNDPICSLEGFLASLAGKGDASHSAGMQEHVMAGIPTWLALTGIVLIILASHLLIRFGRRREEPTGYWHFNLLKAGPLKWLIKRPWFPLMMQSVSLSLFILVIWAGLFGSPKVNIGPVLTWTWWWVLLIVLVLVLGKAFCMVCPWEALSSLVTSISLNSRVKRLCFDRPWPKWARNIFPAILFFLVLTWFELGNDVTHSPMATAVLALTMAGMAVLSALVFEKRAFCRYACLVGRISGIYSMFSPVELRAQSAEVCTSCKTKDCFKGTEHSTPCPTLLFPAKLSENTYCTLCTECVRSCPHDNLGINVRPPSVDLFRKSTHRWDEAILAVVLLSLTSFHGFTMTPVWVHLNQLLRAETSLGPMPVFTVLMAAMLVLPILLFWVGAAAAQRLAMSPGVATADVFKAFAYALVPVALFYHLAHNSMHFFMEAQNLIPLLSDPFGYGWDLFGKAKLVYQPWLSLRTIWFLQIGFIVVGHIYGVLVADHVARKLFASSERYFQGLLPLILTMILYSGFSVWLIAQPMEMRSGM